MSPTLLYLLKANGALLLFATAYFGLLRRLTFFTLNRFYLLFALFFAAIYPALPVLALLPAELTESTAAVLVTIGPDLAGAVAGPTAPALDWEMLALGLYAAGAGLLLARLLGQLLSLGRLRRTARPAVVRGQAVRILAGDVSPFSFWQTIYLNPARHPAAELDAVLRHEQVHVRQWHTPDVLLAQVAQALAWCNPAAWLLRRALLDNLEYLADRAALQTGLDRRAYQYSLLRLSHGPAGPSLVSHFTFPTLKNRVVMMNAPFSSTGQLSRYFVAGPLVLAVALGFSAARAQGGGPVVPASIASAPVQTGRTAAKAPVAAPQLLTVATNQTAPAQVLRTGVALVTTAKKQPIQRITTPIHYVDGKLYTAAIGAINPKDIASITVFKGENARQIARAAGVAAGVVVITTKQNLSQPEVLAFNQKYGVATPPAAEPAQGIAYLAAPALAYITKNHPDARLISVTEIRAADGKTPLYKAEIAVGRRPQYLVFDGAGQLIP